MFKKYVGTFLVAAFLIPSIPAFADRREGREGRERHEDFHRDFHREYVVHRLGPGYVSLMVGGLALLYSEGMFYRYTPAGYVVVTPPVGAVVPSLPPGYTLVVQNGVPYYYYGYTYYTAAPNGYVVASALPQAMAVMPPVPQPAPVPAAYAQPAVQAPAVASAPAAPVNTAPQVSKVDGASRDVYDIYIPNGNGSYTSVTLKKTEKGFLGPQGEFYADHPTVEQLRERYTKK